jgi:hypothetical protein
MGILVYEAYKYSYHHDNDVMNVFEDLQWSLHICNLNLSFTKRDMSVHGVQYAFYTFSWDVKMLHINHFVKAHPHLVWMTLCEWNPNT